jgi:hypothetical protein
MTKTLISKRLRAAGLGLSNMRIWAGSLGSTFNIFVFKSEGILIKVDIPA